MRGALDQGVVPLSAQSHVVVARPTIERDLDFVMTSERLPENDKFVLQWSRPQHQAAIADVGVAHWIIEDAAAKKPVGFVILRRDGWNTGSIEFKRLLITEKKKGYGRATLQLVKRMVFDRFRAHRLWLDVFDYNHRARRLYESEGFVVEGTRRECYRRGDQYQSLVLMSILEHEYRAGKD